MSWPTHENTHYSPFHASLHRFDFNRNHLGMFLRHVMYLWLVPPPAIIIYSQTSLIRTPLIRALSISNDFSDASRNPRLYHSPLFEVLYNSNDLLCPWGVRIAEVLL